MYTQCPECLTIFQIDEDALQASLGIVHCGHCAQRFDALRTLSDTLPTEPNAALAEQDPAELVPTLTAAVPPSAFELAARKRPSEDVATPIVPAQEYRPTDSLPGPVAAETRAPSGDSSEDWFADIETELTSSLIADPTGVPPHDLADEIVWQFPELPVQTRFSGTDIPVIFTGLDFTGLDASDAVSTAELEKHGPLEDESSVPADNEAPGTSGPNAATSVAPDVGLPHSEQTGIPLYGIDPVILEEPGQPSVNETPTPWPHERDIDTQILEEAALDDVVLDGVVPDKADPTSTESDATLPTSGLLPLEIADPDAVDTPDALAMESESEHAEVESDPVAALAPVYVRPRRRRVAGVAWALGCLVLALALAAQLAWTKREELFRNPATHPLAVRVCQAVACHLPPIRDIAKLELLSRDVRPDPHAAGALMITTTVRNNASFRQPWPVVAVALTDLDNNPVAMRRFRPAEYMPDPARRAAGIAPGATAAIAFEVADPGKRAVAFQFSFE